MRWWLGLMLLTTAGCMSDASYLDEMKHSASKRSFFPTRPGPEDKKTPPPATVTPTPVVSADNIKVENVYEQYNALLAEIEREEAGH
jgi:hypothetical protein